jgi:BASS family bile acid:Na+ symporter
MYFPLVALAACIPALWLPEYFTGFKVAIIPMLGLIMFAMGLTQTLQDFTRVFKRPKAIAIGITLQYTIMPLLAFLICLALGLDQQISVGVIIVGCCAGGTASNVITYLAGGNVALSISMTLISTLLGVILTPLLITLYAGQWVDIAVLPMLLSICKIVLLPVFAGISVRYFFDSHVKRIQWLLPHASTLLIVAIIAIVVALNAQRFSKLSGNLVIAVMLHNLLGLLAGYQIAKLFGLNTTDTKTIAIEVGMQNSGLGVALAIQYFSAASALPGALFSIWHNLSGSLLAAYWNNRSTIQAQKTI